MSSIGRLRLPPFAVAGPWSVVATVGRRLSTVHEPLAHRLRALVVHRARCLRGVGSCPFVRIIGSTHSLHVLVRRTRRISIPTGITCGGWLGTCSSVSRVVPGLVWVEVPETSLPHPMPLAAPFRLFRRPPSAGALADTLRFRLGALRLWPCRSTCLSESGTLYLLAILVCLHSLGNVPGPPRCAMTDRSDRTHPFVRMQTASTPLRSILRCAGVSLCVLVAVPLHLDPLSADMPPAITGSPRPPLPGMELVPAVAGVVPHLLQSPVAESPLEVEAARLLGAFRGDTPLAASPFSLIRRTLGLLPVLQAFAHPLIR